MSSSLLIFCKNFPSSPHVLHVHIILLLSITLIITYLFNATNHEAPHYVVFASHLLFLRPSTQITPTANNEHSSCDKRITNPFIIRRVPQSMTMTMYRHWTSTRSWYHFICYMFRSIYRISSSGRHSQFNNWHISLCNVTIGCHMYNT